MGRLRCTALLVLALASAACTDDQRPLTWSYIQPAVVAPSCATASCHSDLTQTSGLTFDDVAASYDQLIDRGYVVPGDRFSPLMYLLEGRERELMPPDAPLPAADVELIRTWIEQGAAYD